MKNLTHYRLILISFLLITYHLSLITPALAQGADLKDEYAFGWISSLGEGLSILLVPAFSIAGIALVFYLIIGAFRFLMSGGDKNAIQGGQNMIVHAIIGFILLMLLFLIVQFIPEFLGINFKIIQ